MKNDFPIFKNHPNLVYLDSASTSLKPQSVIDALVRYYSHTGANIKRGIYKLSEEATEEYEGARALVAGFIQAKPQEIIFTRSTTEGLNLVAYSLGRTILGPGDELVTTIMEHHSNFVPWQVLASEVGAVFKVIDIDEDGRLDLKQQTANSKHFDLENVITKRTKILALSYVSNVLGTINPIKEIAAAAKKINPKIVIVVDAAQAVGHIPVDVKDLGVDFFAFSGHKMLGPSGIGVLWGKRTLLEEMHPFQFGGEMIGEVTLEKTTFAPIPDKFEAGTPAIADVIALGATVEYLRTVGPQRAHQEELMAYCINKLRDEFRQTITTYGPSHVRDRASVVAFNLQDLHPHDVAQILDESDIAIRAGHHCAMPLHKRLGVPATARVSFHLYNDTEDVDKLILALHKAIKILKK